MEGRIIPLRPEPHEEAQLLLPWYVTGQLDAAEKALVESHMAACPECQAEVRAQRRLASQVSTLPLASEDGWAQLRTQIQPATPRNPARAASQSWLAARLAEVASAWGGAPVWLRLTAAVQLCLLLGLAVTVPGPRPAAYHALGAAPAPAVANAILIFRPDTTEADMRLDLESVGARLVGGPTAAGAYLAHIAPGQRAGALARLRSARGVTLAEPIDAANDP